MAAKHLWMKFYPSDWLLDTNLTKCSLETRGFWLAIICRMHQNGNTGELSGTPEELARIVGCSDAAVRTCLLELENSSTADMSVDPCNGSVTLVCKRMMREHKSKQDTALRVKKHRAGDSCNGDVTKMLRGQETEAEADTETERVPLHAKVTFSDDGFTVPEDIIQGWRDAYPRVPVQAEIKKAAQWYRDNPTRQKSNHRRFLGSWMSRCQSYREEKGIERDWRE